MSNIELFHAHNLLFYMLFLALLANARAHAYGAFLVCKNSLLHG